LLQSLHHAVKPSFCDGHLVMTSGWFPDVNALLFDPKDSWSDQAVEFLSEDGFWELHVLFHLLCACVLGASWSVIGVALSFLALMPPMNAFLCSSEHVGQSAA
jgi:hypothetical protein